MELKDLNNDEQQALLALLSGIIRADGQATESEAVEVAHVVDALGEKTYREQLAAAEERYGNPNDLKAFLKTIERQEARNLIYGTLLETALGDTLAEGEIEILDWLREAWNIKVEGTTPLDA